MSDENSSWAKAACRMFLSKKIRRRSKKRSRSRGKRKNKAEGGGQNPAHIPPPRSDWLVHSPSQWAIIGDVEHLVGVEQLPEAVQKVATFKATTPGVHKNQQGANIWVQLPHLHTVRSRRFRGNQVSDDFHVTWKNLKRDKSMLSCDHFHIEILKFSTIDEVALGFHVKMSTFKCENRVKI